VAQSFVFCVMVGRLSVRFVCFKKPTKILPTMTQKTKDSATRTPLKDYHMITTTTALSPFMLIKSNNYVRNAHSLFCQIKVSGNRKGNRETSATLGTQETDDTTLCDKKLSVTCDRSVVFSGYSGFLHQ
jgi:hypothetical protein